MAFAYINIVEKLDTRSLEIEVEKKKYKIILEDKPFHDPDNKIMKK